MAVPVIASPALSDYAITTDETTTASCVITNSPTWVAVWINGKVHRLLLSSTANTYSMALSGEHIGACTASAVVFTATNADGGVQATAASTITVTEVPMTLTGSIEKAPYAMIELLRAEVPLVQKRVYHYGEGVLQSAQMPRITVSMESPGKETPWIGETWGTGKRAVFKSISIRVDVWDRSPKTCEQIGADCETAIWRNRGYHPVDSTYGYFVNMFIAGGTTTMLDPALQLYRRTINVSATWLDINTY